MPNNNPKNNFFGYTDPVMVVITRKQIDVGMNRLLNDKNGQKLHHELFGLDIEWKPVSPGKKEYNPTALLQIYRPGVAVIFRMNKLVQEHKWEYGENVPYKFPESIKIFLEDPGFRKSGLNINQDVAKLKADFGVEVRGHHDIRDLQLCMDSDRKGMKYLAKKYLNLEISKSLAVSDWEQPFLSRKQICYAATDAFISRELFIAMGGLKDQKFLTIK